MRELFNDLGKGEHGFVHNDLLMLDSRLERMFAAPNASKTVRHYADGKREVTYTTINEPGTATEVKLESVDNNGVAMTHRRFTGSKMTIDMTLKNTSYEISINDPATKTNLRFTRSASREATGFSINGNSADNINTKSVRNSKLPSTPNNHHQTQDSLMACYLKQMENKGNKPLEWQTPNQISNAVAALRDVSQKFDNIGRASSPT